MNTAIFEIDITQKGGEALYELLKNSKYAKLVKSMTMGTTVEEGEIEYTFDNLNETSKNAIADANSGITYKSKNTEDLFQQLDI